MVKLSKEAKQRPQLFKDGQFAIHGDHDLSRSWPLKQLSHPGAPEPTVLNLLWG
uniref:Uncharacterized protein n=1 Tax=Suricata suricatta TaxID=37032 RepID=A0A673UZ80_SURSU